MYKLHYFFNAYKQGVLYYLRLNECRAQREAAFKNRMEEMHIQLGRDDEEFKRDIKMLHEQNEAKEVKNCNQNFF